jgi:peptidoglycan hydrolase-like protein with peptidoglycan-binding domain
MIRRRRPVSHLRLAGTLLALAMCGGLPGGCAHTRATPPPPAAAPPTKPDHEHAAETGLPVASTPQGLMRDGAEAKIQGRLQARGFLTAGATTSGQLDQPTRAALRAFQKSEGLPATGLPSYETVRHLDLKLDSIFHTVARPHDPTARSSD